MGQTAKAQEPSMEEILASIRRIIADDETKARAPEPPPKPAPAAVPPRAAAPPPKPKPPEPAPLRAAPPPQRPASQDEIDAMLSEAAASAPQPKAPDDGVADVLDLTESMAAPVAQPPVFRTIESQSDVFFADPEPAPAPPPPPPRMEEPRHAAPMEAPLMSSATSAAVDAAFNTLAHTVLTQNARTLEDLVKDMMRPMLKSWLDDNLPGLVERVVRAEIERVSRGRS